MSSADTGQATDWSATDPLQAVVDGRDLGELSEGVDRATVGCSVEERHVEARSMSARGIPAESSRARASCVWGVLQLDHHLTLLDIPLALLLPYVGVAGRAARSRPPPSSPATAVARSSSPSPFHRPDPSPMDPTQADVEQKTKKKKEEREDRWDHVLTEEGADIVLRSSDGVLMGTRKAYLLAASSVFENMLAIGDSAGEAQDLGKASGEEEDPSRRPTKRARTELQLVDLPEKNSTLRKLVILLDRDRTRYIDSIVWERHCANHLLPLLDAADKVCNTAAC